MPSDSAGKRVLVAWDGSPAAATALPVARVIADRLGATVEAVQVARDAKERNAISGRAPEAEKVRAGLRVELGDPAREIVRWTEQPDTLLVLLTMHGRELGPGYRLGNVAEQVVARTTRPVLIVKPEAAAGRARPLSKLLVPLDGTPKTARALRPVADLAAMLGAEIDLLYVAARDQKVPSERGSMTAPRYVDQPHHEWPNWASEVVERLATSCAGCRPEVPVHIFLAQGEIGDEIARFADEHGTDAIVLVRRSRFQPDRAKVIRSVLKQTSCPVVIVGGEGT